MKNILKRNGYDIGPKRGPGTWDEFIKRHAKTMWQCDFFSKKVVSKTGLRDLFVIVFLNVESRRVYITPASYHPDEAWVLEQAEAFKQHVKEEKLSCKLLMHDRDTKFTKSFDEAFSAGLLTPLTSLKVDGQLPALLTTEHLRRMTAHKRSIAPLP